MEYLIMVLVLAALGGGLYFAIKATNKKCDEAVAKLTEEQKARLMAAEVKFVEGKKNCWTQEALIADAKDKGNKLAIYALYCNKTIDNNFANQIVNADLSIKKDEFEAKGLSVGSFVTLEINAEKCSAKIL